MSVRTFGESHGEDVALEVALEDAPCALVDHEWRFAREPRVQIRLRHDPRRGVRDALYGDVSRSAVRDDCVTRAMGLVTHEVQNLA